MDFLLKLCPFIVVTLLPLLLPISKIKCSEEYAACQNPNYLMISTIDGMLTALDLDTGEKCWSVILNSEKFLSSSLSNFEMYENDDRVWLVPSLDGSLYKYLNTRGRKVIQPLPINVDSLIHHALYKSPTLNVLGSKVKKIYGIDRFTGEIAYICKTDACDFLKSPLPENILVIEERTQSAKTVDTSTGEKIWHFRVSELKVLLTSPLSSNPNPPFSYTSPVDADIQNNALITRSLEFDDDDMFKISIRNGFAGKLNKTTHDFSWSYQTSCPIIDAWYLRNYVLKALDPFEKETGFLTVKTSEDESALLFLGTYENQMFIKKSKHSFFEDTSYNALSASIVYNSLLEPVCSKPRNHISVITSTSTSEEIVIETWDLTDSDYGSYFYWNYSIGENKTHCIVNESKIMEFDRSFKLGYKFFGQYILASILPMIVLFGMVSYIIMYANISSREVQRRSYQSVGQVEIKPTDPEFRSRFNQDFEYISTLGRGGFGVVMAVKNKIDDCRYAVKRIRLYEQLNEFQNEKVLREVKALAKLDHHGIVRYFNAWTEYPPIGFQDLKDKEYGIRDCSTSFESSSYPDLNETYSTTKRKKVSRSPVEFSKSKKLKTSSIDVQKKINEKLRQNPLVLFEHNINDFDFGYSNVPDKDKSYGWSSSSHSESEQRSSCSSSSETNLAASKIKQPQSMDDIIIEFGTEKSTGSGKTLAKHVKFYNMLKDYNNKLVCYQLTVEVMDALSLHFFHDEYSAGVPITDCIVWKKFINQSEIDKLSLQKWLICILCFIKSSDDFFPSQLINNLYGMLSDLSRPIIDDSHWLKNAYRYCNKKNQMFSLNSISAKKKNKSKKSKGRKISIQGAQSNVCSLSSKSEAKFLKNIPTGFLYIQMQLCQKESLKDWLERNNVCREYKKVMEIFSQITDAVHYVHSCGLMHRDLKPSNIYFSLEGAIKIGDFGLATSSTIHEGTITSQKLPQALTSDIGTEIYMSPEQKLMEDYDFKTDIYSLGIIFFELLVPFKTVSERCQALMEARRQCFPKKFEVQYKNESKLLKNLMDEDPENRPTAEEIKQHLLLLKYSATSKDTNQ